MHYDNGGWEYDNDDCDDYMENCIALLERRRNASGESKEKKTKTNIKQMTDEYNSFTCIMRIEFVMLFHRVSILTNTDDDDADEDDIEVYARNDAENDGEKNILA